MCLVPQLWWVAKRSFVIEWPSLNTYVVAEGLDHNIEAQEWFIDSLPLETIQGHAMVCGELLYVMNLVMKREPPIRYHNLVTEDLSKEAVGRVSFFATAGRIGSIMVKYGVVTEPQNLQIGSRALRTRFLLSSLLRALKYSALR